jgi:hypothetical protein
VAGAASANIVVGVTGEVSEPASVRIAQRGETAGAASARVALPGEASAPASVRVLLPGQVAGVASVRIALRGEAAAAASARLALPGQISGAASVRITVKAVAVPDADTANPGGWTDEGGGSTDIWQSIDEQAPPVDADYIRSPLAGGA